MRISAAEQPVLPSHRPTAEKRGQASPFDWAALIDESVHEIKVAVAETLDWIEEPISAKGLWQMLFAGRYEYATVAYHVKSLAELGLIEEKGTRIARGAHEKYYVPAS